VLPGYVASVKKLREHMPELWPVYERLVELAGGGDLAFRFLTLYRPPPYLLGCSQAVWLGQEPFLVRNYDSRRRNYNLVEATHTCEQARLREQR
jgi:predicted choloylglycine hydrolase